MASVLLLASALTLFPDPLVPGETVRFVVAGDERLAPTRAAVSLARRAPGDTLVAYGTVLVGGRPWVETARGFVEACRVDRGPTPAEGPLPVGREGMAAGRVLPDEYRPRDLVALPDSLKVPDYVHRPMSLRAEARDAFTRMIDAAQAEGIGIRIVSAFRSADYQRKLYGRAVERDPVQRTTAPPGRSEHQLGTTVDVARVGESGLSRGLADSDAGRWLRRRAAEFGVVATFSRERHEARGVSWEPWHLRWVGEMVAEEEEW